MTEFTYASGEAVKARDKIMYHGKPGTVDFVVGEEVGDPTTDWYIQEFPGGGFMIEVKGFGKVFVPERDSKEDLMFIARGTGTL